MPSTLNPLAGLLDTAPSFLVRRFQSNAILTRLMRPLVNAVLEDGEFRWVTVKTGPASRCKLLILPQEEKYYWTGLHEAAVQAEVSALLRPGDVFWDVGSHIGLFSLVAARAVRSTGRVHCFEPVPQNRARLEQVLRRNGVPAVVHPYALGDQARTLEMRPHASSLMWKVVDDRERGTVAVEGRTLDDLATVLGLPQLVKIDAEGAEVSVLRGARSLIGSGATRFVVELMSDDACEQVRALARNLRFRQIDARHWVLSP